MRKILSAVLIAALVMLCSCGRVIDSASINDVGSIVDDISSEHLATDSLIENPITPDTAQNESLSIADDISSVTTESFIEKPVTRETAQYLPLATWAGETFGYTADICPSTELLIKWFKQGGTMTVGGREFNEYPWHVNFFDAIRDKRTLIMPKPVNNAVFSRAENVPKDSTTYLVAVEVGDMYEEDVLLDVWVDLKRYSEDEYEYGCRDLIKSEVACPWGTYYYKDAENEDDVPQAEFLYGGYSICVMAYHAGRGKPWNHEYFNYFDFETVSIK